MCQRGASPVSIVAAIGQRIGPCCYEVGDELIDAFRASGHARADIDRWFSRVPRASGQGHSLRLDLARANLDQLRAAGVSRDHIYDCGLCTQTHHHLFDSYRAGGAHAGRMAAVIGVPAPRV
jgi:copper oxidase (laccase) domain-containing protein